MVMVYRPSAMPVMSIMITTWGRYFQDTFLILWQRCHQSLQATIILAMASFFGTTSFWSVYTCADGTTSFRAVNTCADETGDDDDNPGPGFPSNSPFTMMYFLLPLWFCNVSLRTTFQPLTLQWNVTTRMGPYPQICARHDESLFSVPWRHTPMSQLMWCSRRQRLPPTVQRTSMSLMWSTMRL